MSGTASPRLPALLPRAGFDGLLRATFARYRPEPFVSEAALARMLRLGATLPGTATEFFGFECRLGGAAPEPDLLLCVARADGGPKALADGLERAPPGEDPFWARLVAFCRAWDDPATAWGGLISNIWLEFDLAGLPEGASPPVPAVFVGCEALVAGADRTTVDLVSHALDRLAGVATSPARRAALARALAVLPPGGSLFQLGVMISRRDDRLRVCVSGLGAERLGDYLAALGLPDADGTRGALLAELGAVCREVRAGLDADAVGIGRRIGLECYGGTAPEDMPHWFALLRWLRARGLATAAEEEAMLAWWGLQDRRLLRGDWPSWTDDHPGRPHGGGGGALWRSLNHVKITLDPPAGTTSKAYLASRLVWPTDETLRALIAAGRD